MYIGLFPEDNITVTCQNEPLEDRITQISTFDIYLYIVGALTHKNEIRIDAFLSDIHHLSIHAILYCNILTHMYIKLFPDDK